MTGVEIASTMQAKTSTKKWTGPKNPVPSLLLRRAARLCGLQTSYYNCEKELIWSSENVIKKVLSFLTGQELKTAADLQHLIETSRMAKAEQTLNPVVVLWQNEAKDFFWNPRPDEKIIALQVTDEKNTIVAHGKNFSELRPGKSRFSLPTLPVGYFHIRLQTNQRELKTFLIHAPQRIVTSEKLKHSWGAFLPAYALRSNTDWGLGSFSELSAASQYLKKFGGSWSGCLPLLPGNFEQPDCDPSPYSSLSRLFWNEIFLDVEALVQKSGSDNAQKLIHSDSFKKEISRLRALPIADFHAAYQLKKSVLTILSEQFFSAGLDQTAEFKSFSSISTDLQDYARFRSADPAEQRFHLYAQFQTHSQMQQLTDQGVNLYMDYPVGVNDAGFDFKKYREVFFGEVSVGAPPEPIFQKGQDWGFPSFHPQKLQESNYAYFRKSLEHHLRFSKILRLDHVMGLFRAYVVPKGYSSADGVYLRFPPEDLFAIVCLEAHRSGADIIGENLGTVPEHVNQLLHKRHFKGMTVGQFLVDSPEPHFKAEVEKPDLVCLNNHDMPTFQAFAKGEDLKLISELGILDPKDANTMTLQRRNILHNWRMQWGLSDDNDFELFLKFLDLCSKGKAPYFILSPEDGWLEEKPINIPGTYREYPNWRRRFKLAVNEWESNPSLQQALKILKHNRPGQVP